MNKFQQFAVNHYLSDYRMLATFEEITDALNQTDYEDVTPLDFYSTNLSGEEIADEIIQMASDLEKKFS